MAKKEKSILQRHNEKRLGASFIPGFREGLPIMMQWKALICAGIILVLAACSQNTLVTPEPDSPFDHSASFVPLDQLPVVDEEEDISTLSVAELASRLTTVTITRDGKVDTLAPSAEDMEVLQRALKIMGQSSSGGAVPGFEGAVSGLGALDSSGPTESDLAPQTVIGSDSRVRVTNTTSYPFRTIGRIGSGCTGTLIGPRHVLTAGHCVYNIKTNKWYSNLNVTPGQDGSTKPYGTISWSRAISVKGWTVNKKRDFDYAMIVLSQNIGNTTGWFGYGWRNPMPLYNVNIAGYPGDKTFGTMWRDFCTLASTTTYRLYYPCDTFEGQSGSGVYVYFSDTNQRFIYGIHAYGVNATGYNGATRITETVFNKLKSWIATY